jgi:exopolyphosphatase/guanosine-5'-triphosphate,3'-diphosphate pyrophosphatase
MRIAIIDIGTNTINLLVADAGEGGAYSIIHSSKVTARLGKGGINDRRLTAEAIERGIDAIGQHVERLKSYGTVDRIVAIGTSALRVAENSSEFTSRVKSLYGIDVKIIDGLEEASLIYDGAKQVMPIGRERVLILDIGGGSCEFIIADKDGVKWSQSFELGMSRLLDRFTPSDPITRKQVSEIEAYIRPELKDLYEALRAYPTSTLVGTSGSFDISAYLVAKRNHPSLNTLLTTTYEIPLANFDEVYRKIISSSKEQRMEMVSIDPGRVDLIVMGVIFINFVISEMRMERLFQCGFALKQGAIYRIANGLM